MICKCSKLGWKGRVLTLSFNARLMLREHTKKTSVKCFGTWYFIKFKTEINDKNICAKKTEI